MSTSIEHGRGSGCESARHPPGRTLCPHAEPVSALSRCVAAAGY